MKLKIKKNKLSNKQGFTLVELMTVMAIIGILATAIMVSLGVHKKRAEGNKTLTELSGVMQNIYLCTADDGVVNTPLGGTAICNIDNSPKPVYGLWPTLTTGFSYVGDIAAPTDPNGGWFYGAINPEVTICCNALYGKCMELEEDASGSMPICDAKTPLK